MQRLVLIYNPRSSQYVHVKDEVISRITKLKGYLICKYAVKKTSFEDNVKSLQKILQDNDLAIAAGGDATAAIAVNAILESKKDVTLGVLPYGNFNDLARTLGTMKYDDLFGKTSIKKLYPLGIVVDDKHWRYASCYLTIGMTAEAVKIFDDPKFRAYMQKGHKSSWRSYLKLAEWYFKNRYKKIYIPPYKLNGKLYDKNISDYCALSGKSMCRVMKGKDDYLKPKIFRSKTCRLTSFWRLAKLMIVSMLNRVPGTETTRDILEFLQPATVELQAEGEYKTFEKIHKIVVEKPNSYLKVIHK